jgi:hypothetical protein
VAPGEDVQPRSPARRCTGGRTCSDQVMNGLIVNIVRRRLPPSTRLPVFLAPASSRPRALERSVDGLHRWITESCSRLPPDGSDCVSSYATRNSVTSARKRGVRDGTYGSLAFMDTTKCWSKQRHLAFRMATISTVCEGFDESRIARRSAASNVKGFHNGGDRRRPAGLVVG